MAMKPLSKRELDEFFQVYRDAFPEWEADAPYALSRSRGPITQVIGFESLSYGAYRPTCGVVVVGPPDGGSTLLPQMLDVKHRQIERRQHQSEWPKILRAIEDQFVPDVRRPLDVADVLSLAEKEASGGVANLRYLNGLAVLSVYAGHDDRAIKWCDRAEASSSRVRRTSWPDWMVKQVAFARELREAIRTGRANELLTRAPDR
jgi:hypothetical protein